MKSKQIYWKRNKCINLIDLSESIGLNIKNVELETLRQKTISKEMMFKLIEEKKYDELYSFIR